MSSNSFFALVFALTGKYWKVQMLPIENLPIKFGSDRFDHRNNFSRILSQFIYRKTITWIRDRLAQAGKRLPTNSRIRVWFSTPADGDFNLGKYLFFITRQPQFLRIIIWLKNWKTPSIGQIHMDLIFYLVEQKGHVAQTNRSFWFEQIVR